MKRRSRLFTNNALARGAVLTLILFSCQVEEPAPHHQKGTEPFDINEYYPTGGQTILGKQLENPYTVENMQKALANLTANGRISESIDIETTDLYVRFLPKRHN